jgi:glycosyltransferase involved in cell wall biosynthesis
VETFGVVYIEAAGCGLPVITANSGGTLDIVDKSNGIRILNAGVEELVVAMEKVIVCREQYLPEKISENIHKKFGEKAFVKKIEKVYREVLMKSKKKEKV